MFQPTANNPVCSAPNSVAVDAAGNAYVTGIAGTNTVFGTTVLTNRNGTSAFLAKYASTGSLISAAQVAGTGDVYGRKVVVDSTGNIFLAGMFKGTVQVGGTNVTSDGEMDAFLIKYNAQGQFQWISTLGGTNQLQLNGLSLDNSGNILLCGGFLGDLRSGSQVLSSPFYYNAFVVKLSGAGTHLWAVQAGGSNHDRAYAVATDNQGNIFFTGSCWSDAMFGPLRVSGASSGAPLFYLACLDSSGQFVWLRTGGSGQVVTGSGVAVDSAGNCFVAGNTTGGAYGNVILQSNGQEDAFLAKYSPNGDVLWARSIGGPNYDYGRSVAVDRMGNCYLSGDFQETANFGGNNLTSRSGIDGFLAKYNSNGALVWVYGGGDSGIDVAVDASANCWFTGHIFGPTTFGSDSLNPLYCGGFLVKTLASPPVITAQPQDRIWVDQQPATLSVSATGTGTLTYQWFKNGTNFPSANSRTISFNPITRSDEGQYQVIVSDAEGSTTSIVARLSVYYSLITQPEGNGTIERFPQQNVFAPFSSAVITALPSSNSVFAHWYGDASGTNNSLSLTMTNNKTIHALFVSTVLDVQIQGDGRVTKSPDKPFYSAGETVVLTAIPDRYFLFERWGDSPTNNPRTVSIGLNNNYYALFASTTALERLVFNAVSRLAPVGTPAIFVDGQFVTNALISRLGGAQVALQSTYPGGAIFFTLDGSIPTFDSPVYTQPITLSRSATIRALAVDSGFTNPRLADAVQITIVQTFSLTSATAGGGSISIFPSNSTYLGQTPVSIEARPSAGWTFLQWLGDLHDLPASNSLAISRDLCFEAVFGTTFSNTISGAGSVSASPVSRFYPYGAEIRLTALPQPGYYFVAWGNALSSTSNPADFQITQANPSISCLFGALPANQYSLVVELEGKGVVPSPRANRYPSGQTVFLRAVPEPNQEFLGWSGDASGTSDNLILVMNQSKRVKAHFTRRPHIQLEDCQELTAGGGRPFQFRLQGEMGSRYRIDSGSDLVFWNPLKTVTNLYGSITLEDARTNQVSGQFYRAMEVP